MAMDISVLIPTLNEEKNLIELIPNVKKTLEALGVKYELIIIDGGSKDRTVRIAIELGAVVVSEHRPGYSRALKTGFDVAKGKFLITMDADLTHEPKFITKMWQVKDGAELIIASRYIPGSKRQMEVFRAILSIVLNRFFSFSLSLPVKDLSSGFRMYSRRAIKSIDIEGVDFDGLQEILLKVYAKGWKITEVPFEYKVRKYGRSHIKLFKFGLSYLKTFFKIWQLRNSINCADYDYRAYYSRIPLQRYWQRRRYDIIMGFIKDKSSIVDIGCGSSKVIVDLPDAIALDINFSKLLYLRKTNRKLINATIGNLPFKGSSFSCAICSQVIEHTKEKEIFAELNRVLKNEGVLIIGTPDYDRVSWRIIERLYGFFHRGGYADAHITHYSHKTLADNLRKSGFKILDFKYILGSELIVKAIKVR